MASTKLKNYNKQLLKYLSLDIISASISWFLFFLYRKKFIEFDKLGYIDSFSLDIRLFEGIFFISLFWTLLYYIFGEYNNLFRRSRLKDFTNTIFQSLIGVIFIFFIAILDDIIPNYKEYYTLVLVLFIIHFSLTFFLRYMLTSNTVNNIRKGKIFFKTILIGNSDSAIEIYNKMKMKKSTGNIIVGFIGLSDSNDYNFKKKLPYLGSLKEISQIIKYKNIEEVIIAIERNQQDKYLEEILSCLEGTNVIIKIKPNNYDLLMGRVKMTSFFDEPLIQIRYVLMSQFNFTVKRFLDLIVSSTLLILFLPLLLFLSILIKLDSKGSIFYLQERLGKNEFKFKIIKLRTMFIDSELNGPRLTVDEDKRITKIGKYLRKYRIDELPQFINVIKGDMSIVGPRPEREFFAKKIIEKAPYYKHVYRVKPGITSWGMVKFGYASNIYEMIKRLKYDIIYIENMSLISDLKVIIYTILIVFQGRGK